MSVLFRILVLRPLFAIAYMLLHLDPLGWGDVETRQPPTRRVMLRRIRDIKHGSARAMARRLGLNRWEFVLVGVSVTAPNVDGTIHLMGRDGSVVATLTRYPARWAATYECAGSGIDGLLVIIG